MDNGAPGEQRTNFMNTNIKKCPYCGSEASYVDDDVSKHPYVECMLCFARGPIQSIGKRTSAIYEWNRIATMQQTVTFFFITTTAAGFALMACCVYLFMEHGNDKDDSPRTPNSLLDTDGQGDPGRPQDANPQGEEKK